MRLACIAYGEGVSAGGGLAGALRRKEMFAVVAGLGMLGSTAGVHVVMSFAAWATIPPQAELPAAVEPIRRVALHVAPRVALWGIAQGKTDGENHHE